MSDAITAGTPLLDEGIRAVNFFNGRLVTHGDFSRDQQARRDGDARLGQANGSGVVRGLEVSMDGVAGDRRLAIKAGLAVNAAGQTLCLGADQLLALVPAADQAPPETGGGFGACAQLSGGTYVAGDGLYIVTLAPVLRPDGRAPVLALEPGNVRCNTDVMVEAVQLRLLRIGDALLEAHGLDTNVIGDAPVSRLRSSVAAACFGLPHRQAAHLAPGTAPAPDLLADMRERGLAQCDVPLALVFLTTSGGIRFVDRWAVRRRIASGIAAPRWSAWLGEPMDATAQAQLAQFQEQLDDIPTGSLSGLQASNWFTWLPPAGFLKTRTTTVAWEAFLGARKPARVVALAPGDAPAVLAEALRRDAVSIASGTTPAFRVYEITGGPRLFVRNAPNARHAEEVWFDRDAAGMASAWNVQAAIEALWSRTCVQLVVHAGATGGEIAGKLDHLAKGKDLMLCIEPGTYVLERSLRIQGMRHVVVHGHGPGSILRCNDEQAALVVDGCDSLEVRSLAVQGLAPDGRVDDEIGRGGALTVIDVPDVHVSRVHARCGVQPEALQAGALVVNYRKPQPATGRRVLVEHCVLEVGAGQQGLACIHCDAVTLRNNVVLPADVKGPMRLGIVVAGDVAREVHIADNMVSGAGQGIKVALSHEEKEEGEPLKVEHVVVERNRVEATAVEEALASKDVCFGVGIGNAHSVLIRANRLIGPDKESGRAKENRAVHLVGAYGPMLVVRENHFTNFRIGVQLEPVGEIPEGIGDCMWSITANLAEQAELILAMSVALKKLTKGDRNTLV